MTERVKKVIEELADLSAPEMAELVSRFRELRAVNPPRPTRALSQRRPNSLLREPHARSGDRRRHRGRHPGAARQGRGPDLALGSLIDSSIFIAGKH